MRYNLNKCEDRVRQPVAFIPPKSSPSVASHSPQPNPHSGRHSKNLPFLNPLLSAHPTCVKTLVLEFPHHPSLPPGVENVKDIGNHGNVPIINALAKLHNPIFHWFNSHASPPVAIISDFFLGWTHHLAHQLRIPRITFYSSGAFLSSVSDHLWLNADTALSLPVVSFPQLPNTPSFRAEHLPSICRFYRGSDPDWAFVRDCMTANTLSWGRVFNTFDALEGEYLDHLRTQMGHHRVWGVGPLNLPSGSGSMDRGNPSLESAAFDASKAAETQPSRGSSIWLEGSGGRFIWVMRAGSSPPDGFEKRVGERGKVIKGWAPQVSILSHRAVGGFLSHCGWNSLIEGVVCGAMILGWPMEADQYVNAMRLVDNLGAAVRVCEGSEAVPDSAELGRKIAEAMSEDSPQRGGPRS
ncbi:UDP-glycosyltransferase 89A2 [Vitis vinifera]|uniref:UDP-glycosyltransferase 89A2 n=1 Tax=Vitis vinifera TaxID=29760 RepID=A0A438FT05_VITVI|nr:UDP-glycosyltransferase 89A2 [Vitis vinifera]